MSAVNFSLHPGATMRPKKVERLGKQGRYHHGRLREALVEAAREVLDANGLEHLTLREVARRAGVTPAAPYRHFADRAALVAAVAEDGFRELAEELTRSAADAVAETGRSAAALPALARTYVRFALKRPSQYRIMFSAEIADKSAYPELEAAAAAAFDVLEGVVVRSQRDGLVVEHDPRLVSIAAWSLIHGYASLWIEGQAGQKLPQPALEVAEQLSAMLYLGVAPR